MHRSPAAGLVMAISIHAFEQMAVVAIMEPVVKELGGRGVTGLIFGAYLIASILSTVWSGRFIDRRGSYLPMILGLLFFAVGLLLAAAATNIAVLILARAVQGLGGGILQTTAFAVVNRAFDEDRRPRVLAWLSQAWVLPGILGPPAAGALEEFIHWRAVFLITVPLVPVVGWLLLPALRAMKPGTDPRGASGAALDGSTRDAFLLALGTGLILAVATQGRPLPAAVGIVLGAALSVFALRRLLPPGVFTLRPVLAAAVGLKFMAFFAFFGPDSYVPMALVETRGQSVLRASLALIPAALCWALASTAVARMKAPDYARLSRGGLLLLALAVLVLMSVLDERVPSFVVYPAWGMAGFGVGVVHISLSALAMREAPGDSEGAVGTAMTWGSRWARVSWAPCSFI